ncbi:hypothetical protein TIFTF001_029241 [Ficus carica]|uniref:Uncharacterized protein n=1 Tax=Ficus carica TaxID=3494 RepID=A0AA88DR71_FICCA|nr:hypothetical protein TIFTF001_029241 [Ficus carica]
MLITIHKIPSAQFKPEKSKSRFHLHQNPSPRRPFASPAPRLFEMTIGSPSPVANKSQRLANSTSSTESVQPGQSDHPPAVDPSSISPPSTVKPTFHELD